jgi:hypothetical protein
MAYEQKDNSGTLFKNDKREKDTHPHATGTALIDGVEYWVSAWTKEGAKGKFQSLAFKPKEARKPIEKTMDNYDAGRQRERVERGGDLDDEIPFSPEFR